MAGISFPYRNSVSVLIFLDPVDIAIWFSMLHYGEPSAFSLHLSAWPSSDGFGSWPRWRRRKFAWSWEPMVSEVFSSDQRKCVWADELGDKSLVYNLYGHGWQVWMCNNLQYVHACQNTSLHSYMHQFRIYVNAYIPTTSLHAYVNASIPTCIHTCVHR